MSDNNTACERFWRLSVDATQRCSECGAVSTGGQNCQDRFHLMLFWEMANPAFDVHHLMVLCYNLQHPSLYSPEGLDYAKQLLVDFLDRGLTPKQVRQDNRDKLDSGKRQFKITGTPDSHGTYAHPVAWTMTGADVIAGGVDAYCDSVRAWARSVYEALKASGNLPG